MSARAARRAHCGDHRRAVGAGRRDGAGRLTRLRRREEGAGPQAAHRDRHPRPAPGRRGHGCEHRRPGRRDGPADAAAPSAPRHHPRVGRRRLHRLPRRLVPGQTRPDLGDRQTQRRHGRVRGTAEAVGGRAHVRVVDELPPSGPGLRDPARHQRGDDPVADRHADEPASGTATVRRPALHAPDASRRSHPRSARRRAFDRSPSTFAGVASRPSSTAISLARSGP